MVKSLDGSNFAVTDDVFLFDSLEKLTAFIQIWVLFKFACFATASSKIVAKQRKQHISM